MNLFRVLLIVLLFLSPAVAGAQDGQYKLNPGDVLEISVWKEEGLQREVLVLPSGQISFPLVGNIQAAGRTPDEVQKAITETLKKYIPDAVTTVSVINVSGNKVYVIGQVNNPGEFLASHRLDVMQALSMAGGLTPFAAENKIIILRRDGGSVRSIPFRYASVKAGQSLGENIILKSGDTVVVP